jgi:hypothetical protein
MIVYGVHIRCCGNGGLGFRSYSGSLLANAPKVTKRSSPHHSVPRLGSACPNAGLNPWAAAMGHPWPSAANPASCRVTHGFKPAFGQRGLRGALRSKATARGPYSRPVSLVALPHLISTCQMHRDRLLICFAFDFDLGRPVKHAGRNSTLIWGVNRQGCRFSRPAPWMARGGGPPNQCRIPGTPSLGEVPSVGARALCLLWGFSKVSRRKGETHSGHYKKTGYVHSQKGPTQ